MGRFTLNNKYFFKGVFTYLYQKYYSETVFKVNNKYNPLKLPSGWKVHNRYWNLMLKHFYIVPELDLANFEESIVYDKSKLVTIPFDEFKSKGFSITKIRQGSGYYEIVHTGSIKKEKVLCNKPPKIKIVYDPVNERYRLTGKKTGKFDVSRWFNMNIEKKDYETSSKKDFRSYFGQETSCLERYYKVEDLRRKIKIKELPVICMDSGEIACIPRSNDTYCIGIVGKRGCQPAGYKVLMANGDWKNIEDVIVGDKVISPDENGKDIIFATVINTTSWDCPKTYKLFNQKTKELLYECSYNHKIPVRKCYSKKENINGKRKHVKTVYRYFKDVPCNLINHSKLKSAHIVTLRGVEIKKYLGRRNPGIDPYVMGIYLSEGHYTTSLGITTPDAEIIDYVSSKYSFMRHSRDKSCNTYYFSKNGELSKQLIKLGLKWKKSGDKFIPKRCLRADFDYRMQLLAGLIDGDGYVYKLGSIEICSKSQQLIKDIQELVLSLGGKVGRLRQVIKTIKSYNFEGTYYVTSVYFDGNPIPLKQKFKLNRLKNNINVRARHRPFYLEEGGKKRVYGITINSESHLYVTDNFMITGNSGKSFLKNRLSGSMKRHDFWRVGIAIMNDCLGEDFVLGMSPYYGYHRFFKSLFPSSKYLTEHLSALPTIDFHPHFNENMTIQPKLVNDLYLSLPYKEVIEDFTRYFDLNKSGKYLYKIMDKLRACESYKEIKDTIESLDFGKSSNAVHNAIMANVDRLWEQKLLDLSCSVPSKWWVIKNHKMVGEFNPITAALVAGLVPVLNTSRIVNKPWFSSYFRYFLNDIFEKHKSHPYFKGNKIETYVVVDELKNIVTKGRDEKTPSGRMMIRLATEGRPIGLGTIWVNQNYSTVPDTITSNTNYLFSFVNQEANVICKNYSLPRSYATRIKKLKKFEVCGITDSKWVIYDVDGNRRESEEPVFGLALPPLNIHKKPGD